MTAFFEVMQDMPYYDKSSQYNLQTNIFAQLLF